MCRGKRRNKTIASTQAVTTNASEPVGAKAEGAPLQSPESLVRQNADSSVVLTSEHKDALRKDRARTRDQTRGDVCLKQPPQEQIDNPVAAYPSR